MTDFEYLQEEPFERFRIPNRTNPLGSAAAILSFAAYPHLSMLNQRQKACDALLAWSIRQAIQNGHRITPPKGLNRKNLPTDYVKRRVYKTAKRFEEDCLDMVCMGMDLTFRRSGGYEFLATALATHLRATNVSIMRPKYFETETSIIRQHLQQRRATSALSDEKTVIRDFKKRKWNIYLPALPLLTAIHIDILKFNHQLNDYDVTFPGHGKRYLAISLLYDPDRWIHDVVAKTKIRCLLMQKYYPKHTFAEILPEDPKDDIAWTIEGA